MVLACAEKIGAIHRKEGGGNESIREKEERKSYSIVVWPHSERKDEMKKGKVHGR